MNKLLKILSATVVVAFAASCGGGGGSAGTSPFVVGSGGTGTTGTEAADLIVTLSASQLANTGSGTADVTVTAIDASRNAIASVPVTISADGNAVLTVTGTKTGGDGKITGKISTGSDRGNRLITVTATSGSISKTATLQVVGTTITSVLVPAVIAPSTAGEVQYHVVDQAGNPMSGQAVQIVAPSLTPAETTGTTGANGDFVFAYTSPATTGAYVVTANIGGKSDSQTLQVQTTSTVPVVPAGITPSASISANPSVVAVNATGSESNRSEIRVLFLGAGNLPVPNMRVKFDLNGDPNSIGGRFTTGTTVLYSDANGIVTTAYVPGTRSSPTDGVSIRACFGKSDNDPNLLTCGTSKLVTLTVTSEPLGVTIGTNELIIVNELTYQKKFVVSVSDSAGVAKPDVNIVVSLDLPNYRKGQYVISGSKWVKAPGSVVCANEDTNRNGVLEGGEDVNGDGQVWPRKPDVIISLLQTKTRADGTIELLVTYAKDHGSWVDAFITVSASGVSGSEGRATYLLAPVPVDAASISKIDSSPAYQVSPYGTDGSCLSPN
ncbi:MAG: Ig-like domain-containing protein [Caldimonas sp.]